MLFTQHGLIFFRPSDVNIWIIREQEIDESKNKEDSELKYN
jgi:hypothetical protein